jgi:hypothetical protein
VGGLATFATSASLDWQKAKGRKFSAEKKWKKESKRKFVFSFPRRK